MNQQSITEVSIQDLKQVYSGEFIDDDIILFENIKDIPDFQGPRRLNCFLVAICKSGELQYTIDTTLQKASANNMMFISNGQVVENFTYSDDCQGVALMMSDNFVHDVVAGMKEMSNIILFSRLHPISTLTPVDMNVIESYYDLLRKRITDHTHHFRKDVVRSLLVCTLYELSNVIYRSQSNVPQHRSRAESIFIQFITLVEKNFKTERRVSWYSKEMCITAKYLSEAIKSVSGRSPNNWIDNYVILELRVMLKNSNMSIKEITMELNFPNQSFLGKFFKEHVGMSPSQYRNL